MKVFSLEVLYVPIFSPAFREWLSGHPGGDAILLERGMHPENLSAILEGKPRQIILLLHRKILHEITGLKLSEFILKQAKADLWGENDKLPHIPTYQALIAELDSDPMRSKKISKELGFSHGTMYSWIRGTREITLDPMRRVLARIAGEPTSAQVVRGKSAPAKTGTSQPMADSDNPQRLIIGCYLSSLNSQLRLLRHLKIDPKVIYDGDKAQVLRIVSDLLKGFGINATTLSDLQEVKSITAADTELLEIIGAFGSNRRRK